MIKTRHAFLAALLALAAPLAGEAQTSSTPKPAAQSAPPRPDPCAPSQYAKDNYFPSPAFPNQTRAPGLKPTSLKIETLAQGLHRPRALVFLPGGGVLVADTTGLNRIGPDGAIKPVPGAPAA